MSVGEVVLQGERRRAALGPAVDHTAVVLDMLFDNMLEVVDLKEMEKGQDIVSVLQFDSSVLNIPRFIIR